MDDSGSDWFLWCAVLHEKFAKFPD